MKCSILTVIVWGALTLSGAAGAQESQTVPITPAPAAGSPGTATPTPYPQVTPPATPKTSGGGEPMLAPIVLPTPPKDQTIPGLQQNDIKPKSPGG
ncbi:MULTISPECIES: hypothetical protein [Pseudomonas]|uniref:Uncharacterized protein n=1 Tax=Pseudomonas yamanorum TaxID=515393 RepID=A0A7Y8FBP3_9PSED|nr:MULTISPECIES: hypothetical protein [Pseudomonas]MCS3419141.1 hypothetical protein [Pseudomonas sp. BIGb0558]MCS3438633.1 hypothetical protein [Pseudomonas sp. BIGb0450]NVZ85219.1 hypothetical protein [Pseudomonas yamanorum]NWE76336.1 hypothetical protein [Pseudomonas yamanorum]